MCQQVEERGHICPHADGGNHISKLGDRGVGQHPFDVPLGYSDCGGKQGCKRADESDELQRSAGDFAGILVDREHSNEQEDTG